MTSLLYERKSRDGEFAVWVMPNNDGRYKWFGRTPRTNPGSGTICPSLSDAITCANSYYERQVEAEGYPIVIGPNEKPRFYNMRIAGNRAYWIAYFRRGDGYMDARIHSMDYPHSHSFRRLRIALKNGVETQEVENVNADPSIGMFTYRRPGFGERK